MTQSSKELYVHMSSEELWVHFGGELIRGNVSRVIRVLHQEGFTTGQIAKMTGKRYQHVRNVLNEPVKK